jgi:hypothetical protein
LRVLADVIVPDDPADAVIPASRTSTDPTAWTS